MAKPAACRSHCASVMSGLKPCKFAVRSIPCVRGVKASLFLRRYSTDVMICVARRARCHPLFGYAWKQHDISTPRLSFPAGQFDVIAPSLTFENSQSLPSRPTRPQRPSTQRRSKCTATVKMIMASGTRSSTSRLPWIPISRFASSSRKRCANHIACSSVSRWIGMSIDTAGPPCFQVRGRGGLIARSYTSSQALTIEMSSIAPGIDTDRRHFSRRMRLTERVPHR